MELRQLEYFAAVARHGNVTRASEEIHVTQSAISQQLRRLEAELGVALLHRTPSGVALTSAGADLLARAEAVLHEVARARADMDAHAGVRRGAVRVATTAADAARLARVVAGFHREHPGVRIGLRQGSAGEAMGLVRNGAADLAVVGLGDAAAASGVRAVPLADEPLRVMCAPGDALAAGGPVAIADLRERALILAEPGTALRETVMAACALEGFSPIPLFEVADPAAARYLAHAGLGVSIVPASWLDAPGPDVAVAPLADPAPRHRLWLLAGAGEPSAAARLLHARVLEALGGDSEDLG
jgi:DNA-binding transcriptional LysR family regulator